MSDIQPTITGFISPYGDYNLRNTQVLGGVSHIWQDFFARALAEQSGEVLPQSLNFPPVDLQSPVEPTVGSDLLAHIVSQRECDVKDNEVRPPEPLFLPIAEFEMDLADKPFPPFPAEEIVAQQQQQDQGAYGAPPGPLLTPCMASLHGRRVLENRHPEASL